MTDNQIKAMYDGGITIGIETDSEDGTHRVALLPGNVVQGEWVDTDIAQYGPDAVAIAAQVWTPKIVEVYKTSALADFAAIHEALEAIPVINPIDKLKQFLSDNPDVKDLISDSSS